MDIYEVSSGGPSEQREGLVGRQLLVPNGRTKSGLLDWPQPGVVAEINLAAVLAARQLESNIPGASTMRATVIPARCAARSNAGAKRFTAVASRPKKSRSSVSRSTIPVTVSAAPPARAKPAASGTSARSRATSCW